MTAMARERSESSVGSPIPAMRLGTTHKVAFDAAAPVDVSGFVATTSVVRVFASADCHVACDPSAVATTADAPFTAGFVEYLGLLPGDKISVIGASGTGFLYVTECE